MVAVVTGIGAAAAVGAAEASGLSAVMWGAGSALVSAGTTYALSRASEKGKKWAKKEADDFIDNALATKQGHLFRTARDIADVYEYYTFKADKKFGKMNLNSYWRVIEYKQLRGLPLTNLEKREVARMRRGKSLVPNSSVYVSDRYPDFYLANARNRVKRGKKAIQRGKNISRMHAADIKLRKKERTRYKTKNVGFGGPRNVVRDKHGNISSYEDHHGNVFAIK